MYSYLATCIFSARFSISLQECRNLYDKAFADEFEQFLADGTSSTDFNSKLSLYLSYIEDHLKSKTCQLFCSKLWLVFQLA